MNSSKDATLSDWLMLHGLSQTSCRTILENAPKFSVSAQRNTAQDYIKISPEEVWEFCAQAIKIALPDLGETVIRTVTQTTFQYAVSPEKHTRAFTLHNPQTNAPIVYCPWFGRLSDVTIFAHEFGHAFQLTASKSKDMPPISREVCAFLSEYWMEDFLSLQDGGLGISMRKHLENKNHLNFRKAANVLQALERFDSLYTYDWNYPVAQIIAHRARNTATPQTLHSFFSAQIGLPEFLDSLPF